ncbi:MULTISPECIES: hypothetical protein [Alistipes]|uniref:hypothetical protein n=1 Tax=Alistipes TaxID=239759 RepID=UPI003AB2F61C
MKKRLRRPCFCHFSGIIRIFDFVEDRPRGKMQASLLLLSPVRIFANGRTRFAHAVFSVRGRL